MRRWIVALTALLLLVATVGQVALGADAERQSGAGIDIHKGEPAADASEKIDAARDQFSSDKINPLFVFGPDDRTQMDPADPRVAWLLGWDESDQSSAMACSATFIGPNVLLTAAHCLYDTSTDNEEVEAVDVFPGINGFDDSPYLDDDSTPFGWFEAASWYFPEEYATTSGASMYDYAIVVLDQNVGAQTGMMTIGVLSDETLAAADLNVTTIGYPGDKDLGTQWTTSEPALVGFDDHGVETTVDMVQGQSGSAVFRGADEAIFGVVSYEFQDSTGHQGNVARRMDTDVLAFFDAACAKANCTYQSFVESVDAPPAETASPTATSTETATPTETATATETATEPSATPENPSPAFARTWQRTDAPVADGTVSRTWIWGPGPNTDLLSEPYVESPGGNRLVQYYDKSRMEITTDPAVPTSSPWYVVNGLLVKEMVTGNLQLGNDTFEAHQPAQLNVAGDPNGTSGPTYATFSDLLDVPPLPVDSVITERVDRAGVVTDDPALAELGVTAGYLVPETNHTVASVFWDFMNASGLVSVDGLLVEANLFENPFHATGLPITEAYWTTVEVGGVAHEVLVQAFERRVLTYTPDNPVGWQVEAGNVGQHYYHWRYDILPAEGQ